ncbi:MAG: branched-chain amino acid ABC transporter substrate-binding protein, partial [candidate division KSB1 bacterium]|nr:branched-chain amino acid ABC transporter substrate-binding protein [candidate division KSB1 bacterium]
MKLKLLVVTALLAAALLVVSACAGLPGAAGGTIKIISSTPLTGGDAAPGQSMAFSAQLALEKHGAKSGNYTITFEALDDASAARGAWDPDVETSNANKAAADPQVMVYLGTYNSGAAKLSIPILNQAGPLVMISGANTYPGLTKAVPGVTDPAEPNKYYPTGVRNYARTVPADDIQGAVDARWAKELGAKSVYILDDQQLYGKGIADVFEKTAKELGMQVLGHEGIDVKATDYSAQATKIVNANPDLFFFGGVTSSHAGLVWKAIRAAGFKGIMMAPDGLLTEDFLKEAGADAEGTYITFAGLPVERLVEISPEGKQWREDYVKKFGKEPDPYGIYGYEAALVAFK